MALIPKDAIKVTISVLDDFSYRTGDWVVIEKQDMIVCSVQATVMTIRRPTWVDRIKRRIQAFRRWIYPRSNLS